MREQLKRYSLELGASRGIVLDDADVGRVAGLKMASLMNNGQACVAQTRILVSEARHDEFVAALADMMSELIVGDPTDTATDVGPLVARRQQRRVQEYIRSGQAEGARMVLGGADAPHDQGWYVRPTLFVDATNDMRIAREEIFFDPGAHRHQVPGRAGRHPHRQRQRPWSGRVGMDPPRRAWAGTRPHRCAPAPTASTCVLDISQSRGGFKQSGIGQEFGVERLEVHRTTVSRRYREAPAIGGA